MISSKTLFLTEDRADVVEEGDPKAKFLLVKAGMELPDALAERYGVKADKKAAPIEQLEEAGPQPQNREQAMPKIKTRGKNLKK